MSTLVTYLYVLIILAPFFVVSPVRSDAPGRKPRIQIIITTECGEYFTWQSLGFFYSFKKIGQMGNLTRVMCCTQNALQGNQHVNIVPTHVAPDYTEHPTNGDVYQAYNKPVAVIDYLDKVKPDIDYLLVIDADMILMRQMDPVLMGVKPGLAVAAHFGYMKGTYNELAEKHIPEIAPRNDTLAGVYGRRSDDCGGFTFMTLQDIAKVAPLWLKYTEDVRLDPDAWRLTGDVYATKPGLRPWIAEMYGYSYGAAKAGVWHYGHRTGMVYPEDEIQEAPYVMHYGLEIKIPGTDYFFDKHDFLEFNALLCPPWDLAEHEKPAGGLFRHPPFPSQIKTKADARYRDVHAIATINTLNEALCERHYMDCPPSEELDTECRTVHEIAMEVHDELVALEAAGLGQCRDVDVYCKDRLARNECVDNAGYTQAWCRKTCGACRDSGWERRRYIADWQKKFLDEGKVVIRAHPVQFPRLGRKGALEATEAEETKDSSEGQEAGATTQEEGGDLADTSEAGDASEAGDTTKDGDTAGDATEDGDTAGDASEAGDTTEDGDTAGDATNTFEGGDTSEVEDTANDGDTDLGAGDATTIGVTQDTDATSESDEGKDEAEGDAGDLGDNGSQDEGGDVVSQDRDTGDDKSTDSVLMDYNPQDRDHVTNRDGEQDGDVQSRREEETSGDDVPVGDTNQEERAEETQTQSNGDKKASAGDDGGDADSAIDGSTRQQMKNSGSSSNGPYAKRRMTQEDVEDIGLGVAVEKHWPSLVNQIHGFGALMWVALFVLFIMLAPRVRRARTPQKLKPRRLTFDQLDLKQFSP